jgi:predicted RNA-binding Zn-ribbon protein involved in translation (DUF1610 family)
VILSLSVSKRCEVCGGNVRPNDEQADFGYCEKCGIVYALGARIRGERSAGVPGSFRGDLDREEVTPKTAVPPDDVVRPRASAFRWRCPDCNEDLGADNAVDLEFLKRGHIREYHPNR